MRKHAAHHFGFTLVELSIVITIIALITGMSVSMGIDVLETAKRSSTESRMNEIEKSLLKFREVNDRLPCPALSTAAAGTEVATAGVCASATYVTVGTPTGVPSGAVPVVTLGLPLDYIYDGWGRKFQYEVVADMTAAGSFSLSLPSDICIDNGISIYEETYTSTITNGAVYALNSFGKNGIGAYNKSGARVTSGTVGTHEGYANRSTNTSPTYVYKSGVRGDINTVGYYDDILRYKLRSQLMTDDDRKKNWYRGPQALFSQGADGSTNYRFARFTCGRLSISTTANFTIVDANSAAITDKLFAEFLPRNTHLLVYGQNTGASNKYCTVFPVYSTGLGAAEQKTFACPSTGRDFAVAAGSGTFSYGLSTAVASPYMEIWQWINKEYVKMNNPVVPPLAAYPPLTKFSDDGQYMTLSYGVTNTTNIYVLREGQYHKMVDPTGSGGGQTSSISPNGRYYMIANTDGSNTTLRLWRNNDGTFTAVDITASGYNVFALASPSVISFSSDSTMFAVMGSGVGAQLSLFSIDQTDDSIFPVDIDAQPTGDSPFRANFSNDNQYIIITSDDTTAISSAFAVYRRSPPTTVPIEYIKQTWPSTITTSVGGNEPTGALAHW